MRTGGTVTHTSLSTSAAAAPIHSPSHSPIPYLFGGLAAMLCLIALSLLILACSHKKLSSSVDNDRERSRDDGDEKSTEEETIRIPVVYENQIVVIMAGDVKPSYLATPIYLNTSSFEHSKNAEKEDESKSSDDKPREEEEENPHHDQSR
ncbi:protein GLUTAMINE DUMPER 2-like isoform X2 [Papaver somniferum]|uniref:protein GLUTAMINE DUMPER 2-like isoform X2 n=1 Tax=Papaver somniferum TaxID=3469 RepID=UPI000E6F9265|nr:protein GLUTAMINE DUMPER 2-like isoform X2 [Papaver somniferum]